MAVEYVKVQGSDSVYKVDGNSYQGIATPQAFAQLTGQNPNGQINWSSVKTVGANYLSGKQNLGLYSGDPSKFQDVGQVNSHLNNLQQGIQNTGVQSYGEIVETIKPLLPKNPPAVPNLLQTYKDLRTEYGMDALEMELTNLQAEKESVVAEKRQRTNAEEGKTVPLNVIAGRVGEVERQENERIDVVDRRINTLTNQYTAKLNTVKTIMDLTNLDYGNAKAAYDSQFSQAMEILTQVRGIRQEQLTEQQRLIDNARADLQIYTNLITKGNLDINSIPADQRAQLSRLEVAAGFPVGFISSIKKDVNADILFTTSNEGITQVGFRNPDGTVTVRSYGTRISSGSGGSVTERAKAEQQALNSKATQLLDSLKNSYGHVSPSDWSKIRSAYVNSGGTVSNFIKEFGAYTDPYRGDFEASYGFNLKNRSALAAEAASL